METINLEDFVIPRTAVPVGKGKQIMVRGLCADDIALMVSQYLPEITKAVELYQEKRANVMQTGNLTEFLMTFARDFPAVVAEVISAATDSHGEKAREVAQKMPISIQLAAINEITRLTMEDAGGLKNLLAEMQAKVREAVESARAKS